MPQTLPTPATQPTFPPQTDQGNHYAADLEAEQKGLHLKNSARQLRKQARNWHANARHGAARSNDDKLHFSPFACKDCADGIAGKPPTNVAASRARGSDGARSLESDPAAH